MCVWILHKELGRSGNKRGSRIVSASADDYLLLFHSRLDWDVRGELSCLGVINLFALKIIQYGVLVAKQLLFLSYTSYFLLPNPEARE